jgi:hypothetical protein
MCRPHQLGCATELRSFACRGDDRYGFTPTNECTGVGFDPGPRLDRQGLAGNHRLVEQHAAIMKPHIGGNDTTQGKLDHISRNDL